ncbi:Nucleoside-diphosphate-sugar epimerase [Nitrosomonas cryotolerans]|uniref:Nucleoside-diphosphate-sugar epimerase n=1 Tax=Nitrosomonas cryotolerans ATCC 49181 TaxID=1131553 RepID=A0A1N6GXB2_9PROT|nr:NAD(P)-dependent oxidoreductase [Nitrosomonas cryotolerans]SFP42106.1 Nucleoside-diphosphate-sugar epimerase [Nitrosomonas cryotolerans]SIO12077.1 Nucleoside-diphosphate-sugar epimerase [Nitrosomonas cryotolerans ATCC 49181]
MLERQAGVLGATSLVGECLLRQLAQDKWRVTAFSRRPVTQSHAQISWRQLDSPAQIRAHSGPHKKIAMWLCIAPIWILPAYFSLLLAHGARRIIVLSSTSRFTKNNSPDPGEQAIAQRLADNETQLSSWAAANEIEWIILRPTLIYGYGRDKNITEIARFIRRFGFFPLLGTAHGLRQPIHAEDVAAACLAALTAHHVSNRAYNLTGLEKLSYRDMVQRIFTALGQRPRLLTVSPYFFQLAIKGLRWLPRYRHWTPAMAERMNTDLVFDDSDTRRDLHFSPRPLNLTIKELITRS